MALHDLSAHDCGASPLRRFGHPTPAAPLALTSRGADAAAIEDDIVFDDERDNAEPCAAWVNRGFGSGLQNTRTLAALALTSHVADAAPSEHDIVFDERERSERCAPATRFDANGPA
ncbi:MAG TPA: hypothetical protein VFS15_13655 [Kofleriaceae bacterium]|nr:hypothetical protein [Kofleriaceae bacterium]